MNGFEFTIKEAGSLGQQTTPNWQEAVNYGNVIARMGREVTITDLYNFERHTVITDGIPTPIGNLIVRAYPGRRVE